MSFKSGFISIIGRPNVGKSTLLNHILGEKIAAVSAKPQTTRTKIMGVVTSETSQLVFLDTPGIHKPKNKLGQYMMRKVGESAGEADVVLYLADASDPRTEADEEILRTVSARAVFLVPNKIDTVAKEALLPLISRFSAIREFDEVVPISALRSDGVDRLLGLVEKYIPAGPKFFPDDTLTDQPERQICAELIREKLMRLLGDEVPYGTAVAIERMKYNEEKEMTVLQATIFCERDSHKAIIIGKGGAMLKKIGTDARVEIERFTGGRVFLELWVKVRENWRNSDAQLKNLGYDND